MCLQALPQDFSNTQQIHSIFSKIVDDFGVKYTNKEDTTRLVNQQLIGAAKSMQDSTLTGTI